MGCFDPQNIQGGNGSVVIPGFGKAFSIKLPKNPFEVDLPGLEFLQDYMDQALQTPAGKMEPTMHPNSSRDYMDSILTLLSKVEPLLMHYKMFLVVLKIIVCVIEVICALMNPFSLIGAVCKLFGECIPEFLSIFPPFAIPIFLASILKLLVAILMYIAGEILIAVLKLRKEVEDYARATLVGDDDAMQRVANAIADILCFMQNLLVGLSMLANILRIIEQIIKFALGFPCGGGGRAGSGKPASDNDGSTIDGYPDYMDGGCCSPESCPQFLRYGNIESQTGELKYYNEIKATQNPFWMWIPNLGKLGNSQREQSFQLYDPGMADKYKWLINMVTPQDEWFRNRRPSELPQYFPADQTFSYETPVSKVPFTIDMRHLAQYYTVSDAAKAIFDNPANKDRVQKNPDGTIFGAIIKWKDCIVKQAPKNKMKSGSDKPGDFTGQSMPTGVCLIGGGTPYWEDGTKFGDLTVETFFGNQEVHYYGDFTYTIKPNFAYLFAKSLISAGCIPQIRETKEFYEGTIGLELYDKYDLLNSLVLPDPIALAQGINNYILELSQDISNESLDKFQANINDFINSSIDGINNTIGDLIFAGFSRLKSNVVLDPQVQWTGRKITVRIMLRDGSGSLLTEGLSPENAQRIIAKLQVAQTFGTISAITYDGVSFNATIESFRTGTGYVIVTFDNQVISKTILRTSSTPPSVDTHWNYEFVGSATGGGTGTGEPGSTGVTPAEKPERDQFEGSGEDSNV